jgi:hypothetical protein
MSCRREQRVACRSRRILRAKERALQLDGVSLEDPEAASKKTSRSVWTPPSGPADPRGQNDGLVRAAESTGVRTNAAAADADIPDHCVLTDSTVASGRPLDLRNPAE